MEKKWKKSGKKQWVYKKWEDEWEDEKMNEKK